MPRLSEQGENLLVLCVCDVGAYCVCTCVCRGLSTIFPLSRTNHGKLCHHGLHFVFLSPGSRRAGVREEVFIAKTSKVVSFLISCLPFVKRSAGPASVQTGGLACFSVIFPRLRSKKKRLNWFDI